MTPHAAPKLDLRRKIMIITAGMFDVVVPAWFALVGAGHIAAQLLMANRPLQSFEVATIKPSQSAVDVYNLRLDQDRLTAEGIPLDRLIRFAYNVKTGNQIENVPVWAGAEKFDINAKVADVQLEKMKDLAPELRFEQYQFMLQSLLADRFSLKVSTRMKELPVYALAVAKRGPKLTAAAVSSDPRDLHYGELVTNRAKGEMKATGVSTARLVQWLSGTQEAGDRVVIDETGLTGRYDFALKWTPIDGGASAAGTQEANEPAAGAPAIDQGGPSLFTALEEQLGLKLVPQKAPVEVLVINQVEQPSAN